MLIRSRMSRLHIEGTHKRHLGHTKLVQETWDKPQPTPVDQKNRFIAQHFRLASFDCRESDWQHKRNNFPAALMWSCCSLLNTYQSRWHHPHPSLLREPTPWWKTPTTHTWKKEGSRSWKRWSKEFSTRPNFHIICSNLHGCGTEGQELSPGGAHGKPVEGSLSPPSQSTAYIWGMSHVKAFKPVQYSELEAFSISTRMQIEVQKLMALQGIRGAHSLLDPKGEEMGYRVCNQVAVTAWTSLGQLSTMNCSREAVKLQSSVWC